LATNDNIPVQGIPGLFPDRDPTLLPNFYIPTVGDKTVGLSSPSAFLTANPRVDATATGTIGGSVTTSDIITLTVTNGLLGGPIYGSVGAVSVAYTVQAGDSLAMIAENLTDLINDNALMQSLGFRADVDGAVGAVITFHQGGPAGNLTTVTRTLSGGATETVTFSNAGVLSGGTGPIIPVGNFVWSRNGVTSAFWYGSPRTIGYDQVIAMVAQGQPIV